MQQYAPASRDEAFAQARECFAETEDWLASGDASGMQHADLEEQMEKRGREITRRMLQGHLDLLAAREERRHDVTGDDGVVRTRAERGRVRPLMTKFGQVSVSRIAYRSPDRSNVHPLDAALNLPEKKHSHGHRKLAPAEAARVARGRGGRDRPRGRRADREAPGRSAGPPRSRARGGVLPVAGDRAGAGRVPAGADLRRERERDAAGRATPGHRESSSCRGGHPRHEAVTRGEERPERMAELACVYDAVSAPRTPEEVISTPAQKLRKKKAQAARPKGKGKPREPQARSKWLTASVTDDIPAVIAASFDEAERRDPGHNREWVVLIDGNNTQIDAVTAEAARRATKVTIGIDFIHVLEYLWKAAWSFFEKGEPAAEEWVAAQARKVLHGKISPGRGGDPPNAPATCGTRKTISATPRR